MHDATSTVVSFLQGRLIRGLGPKNLLYLHNPKAGCSFVLSHLWKISGMPPGKRIHNVKQSPFEYRIEFFPNIENAFVFSFVRNPFARCLSAYNEKVNPNTIKRDENVWRNFAKKYSLAEDAKLSFADFVGLISNDPDPLSLDPHWRPQHINILNAAVRPNFIGYVETLNEDFGLAMRTAGVEDAVVESRVINKGSSDTRGGLQQALSQDRVVENLVKLYRNDFEAYGYSFDPAAQIKSSSAPVVAEGTHPVLRNISRLLAAVPRDQSFELGQSDRSDSLFLDLQEAICGKEVHPGIWDNLDEAARLQQFRLQDRLHRTEDALRASDAAFRAVQENPWPLLTKAVMGRLGKRKHRDELN